MKKYVGVKLIEAQPMTRGDYNKYRGWIIPENENPNDEGYLLKYSDDYVSWSPKQVFDEAYREYRVNELPQTALGMISENYKERFKAEYRQVKIRYDKLDEMTVCYEAGTLPFTPTCSLELLKEQKKHMGNYIRCLKIRAQIENIDLMEEN
ncbi:MAG: crAss001_48 related protein [Thomasclavelia sp.]